MPVPTRRQGGVGKHHGGLTPDDIWQTGAIHRFRRREDPPAPPNPSPPSPPAPEGDPPPDDPKLGPAGEKALEEWKRRAKDAEKATKDRDAELDKLRKANQSEQEKALDAARKEAAEAARNELDPAVRSARLENAILRSAVGHFADVEDAVLYLRDADVLDDDGAVDTKRLDKARDSILERKPHLKANVTSTARPHQGAEPARPDKARLDRIAASVKATTGIS